jgi:hypothetical protein
MKHLKTLMIILTVMLLSCNTIDSYNNYTDYEKKIKMVFREHGDFPIGPFINIEIDNKPYMAFFDTGFGNGVLQLKQNFIEDLALEITGEARARTFADTHVTKVYEISEFIIDNNLSIYNGRVDVMPDEFLRNNEIIMGLATFKNYNILVSYKQNKIFLYDKDYTPDLIKKWTAINLLKDYDEGIYFRGNFGGSEYVFCLDTGGSSFWESRQNYYDLIVNRKIYEYINKENDTTFFLSGRRFKNNRLLHQRQYENMEEILPMDLLLGYDFLKKYDVYIDKTNMKMYVEK